MRSYAPSEKLGGGTLKETTLWTNPSPNSAFPAQTASLSQTIDSFDFVRIYFNPRIGVNATNSFFVAVDDFKRMINNYDTSVVLLASVVLVGAQTVLASRRILYTDDTNVYFVESDVNSNYIIPTQITGCKL